MRLVSQGLCAQPVDCLTAGAVADRVIVSGRSRVARERVLNIARAGTEADSRLDASAFSTPDVDRFRAEMVPAGKPPSWKDHDPTG